MADITVEKYGRSFEFPEGTDVDTQTKRIESWMAKNAPKELSGGTGERGEAADAPKGASAADSIWERITNAVKSGEPLIGTEGTRRWAKTKGRALNDFATTFNQGITPYADEGVAAIKSLLGGNYDEALANERAKVKRFGEEAGPGAQIGTEIAGGLAGAVGTAAGAVSGLQKGAQYLPSVAAWVGRHPWLATTALGAGTGAAQGFGAGEGGVGPRLENAAENAAIGAVLAPATKLGVEGGRWAWDKLYGPNAMAAYLRGRIPSELGDTLAGTPGIPKLPTGRVDPNAPDFGTSTERVMNRELQRQRRLSTNPMLADLMPGTTEAVLQKPGEETADLAKRLGQRQYNFDMAQRQPDLADALSQRGRVGDWFDYLFGQDKFKADEKQLIDQLQQTGRTAYAQAYGNMVNSPRLERSLGNPYVQQAWDKAAKLAEADGRRIGVPIRGGNGAVGQYDVQFLHDLKTTMDDMLRGDTKEYADKFLNPRTGRMNKEGFRLNGALRELNNSIKEVSPEYADAAKKYASDAEVVGALKRGHEDFFGTPERGGMGIPEIRKFFRDPNIRDEVKDAMRIGAARAARAKLMEGEGKAYTHNWSDFINKPEFADRLKMISQPHLWDTAFNALRTESKNYSQVAKATANSRTSARQQMTAELDNASPTGAIADAAVAATTKSPTIMARTLGYILDHASPNRMGTDNANKMAKLLAAKTPAEQRAATRQIRDLLDRSRASSNTFDTLSNFLPYASTYAFPGRD